MTSVARKYNESVYKVWVYFAGENGARCVATTPEATFASLSKALIGTAKLAFIHCGQVSQGSTTLEEAGVSPYDKLTAFYSVSL